MQPFVLPESFRLVIADIARAAADVAVERLEDRALELRGIGADCRRSSSTWPSLRKPAVQ
jgi:hypothetical protein